MRTIDIEEAKTHLSRLIEQAAAGEPFVITKAGRPLAKMVPLNAPDRGTERRLGFLTGQAEVPDDVDRMEAATIDGMFGRGA